MRQTRQRTTGRSPIRRCFIGVLAIGAATAAAANCLPPEPPIGTDPALVTDYRQEVLADYERYFSESSAFIACLDEARGQAMADLSARVTDYETLFKASEAPMTPLQSEDH